MRPPYKHTHLRSTLSFLKKWRLLFAATFVFREVLLAERQVSLLHLIADESRPGKKNSKMKRRNCGILASVGFVALLYSASPILAQTSLGTAQSFAVLGGSAVTNIGPTVINGDLGVSPGSAITGFPPGSVVGGTIHNNNAVALQAQNDVTTAYNALAGMACNTSLTGQDLGGLTLTPGVYCFSSSAQLTGTLTLDAQGNPNALFIFQIGSTLTTASNSTVNLINGAQPCNVFWQVGSSATLGTTTKFVGSILALQSITLNTGASISGRALARNGAVTMDNNTVTKTNCGPSLGVAFSPTTINAGGVSTKTITLINPNSTAATITTLTDNLPTGLVIAATPNASTTCGGVLAAPAGGSTITLTGGTIPGGAPGTCTVTVNVTAAVGGNYINTLSPGDLQTSNGSNADSASATLTVVPLTTSGTPLLSKAFNPATSNAGGISSLTITLINPNTNAATLTAPLTDNLPTGLVIAATPNASNTCGGVLTAIAGGSMVTLTGGTIPAATGIGTPGTCTVTVNVTAAMAGSYINTIPAGALQTTNGSNADSASATLTVVPLPLPAPTPISDDKPGSVLIFPYYTSDSSGNFSASDTLITISNVCNGPSSVNGVPNYSFLHLFFINSACSPADTFVCLTPNGSIQIQASVYDPGTTGYLIAVAVDANGNPTQNNCFIGSAYVRDNNNSTIDSYGAEAFWKNSMGSVASTNGSATINLNGVDYEAAPTQFSVQVQDPAVADESIVLASISGNLGTSLTATSQSGVGLLYRADEAPASFQPQIGSGCFSTTNLDSSKIRIVPGSYNTFLKDTYGYLKFNVASPAVGLLISKQGATANYPNNRFSGIRTLHQTQVGVATLTAPVFPPFCVF